MKISYVSRERIAIDFLCGIFNVTLHIYAVCMCVLYVCGKSRIKYETKLRNKVINA